MYERRLIRVASPLFHIGILAVLVGHVVGLLIPEAWTDAVHISESMYHAMAVFMIWPFTRLVHAFSAPLGYLFRPYVVYRDRGPHDPGSRATHRGWEKIGS